MENDTITFAELAQVAPEIATPILDKFRSTGIGILGTLRRDGGPRVSPVEIAIVDDRLWIGMMPGSRKYLDVVRDPRVAVLTPVADRDDLGGEGKLIGRLEPVTDPVLAERVLRAAGAEAGFDAEAVLGSPLFELRIESAAWQHVADDAWNTRSWRVGETVRWRRRQGATGDVEDVPAAGVVDA